MIEELSEDILKEVNNKLNKIYNYRKDIEGVISSHNLLIQDLQKVLMQWHKKNINWEKDANKRLKWC
jgi:hypothetical protein